MSDTVKGILAIILLVLASGYSLYLEVKANYKPVSFKFKRSSIFQILVIISFMYLLFTLSDQKVIQPVAIMIAAIQIPVVCFISYKKWKNTKEIQYLLPFLYPVMLICLLLIGIKYR